MKQRGENPPSVRALAKVIVYSAGKHLRPADVCMQLDTIRQEGTRVWNLVLPFKDANASVAKDSDRSAGILEDARTFFAKYFDSLDVNEARAFHTTSMLVDAFFALSALCIHIPDIIKQDALERGEDLPKAASEFHAFFQNHIAPACVLDDTTLSSATEMYAKAHTIEQKFTTQFPELSQKLKTRLSLNPHATLLSSAGTNNPTYWRNTCFE